MMWTIISVGSLPRLTLMELLARIITGDFFDVCVDVVKLMIHFDHLIGLCHSHISFCFSLECLAFLFHIFFFSAPHKLPAFLPLCA